MRPSSPDEIANYIRMRQLVNAGPVMVVEGDTDATFLSRFVDPDVTLVHSANSKSNVLEVIRILEGSGILGAVGIVDSDFDRLSGTDHGVQNLISTDVHDIDMLLFKSPALDKVLAELCSVEKKTRFEEVHGRSIMESVLENLIPLSKLRWISERDNLGMSFREYKIEKFAEPRSLTLNEDNMLGHFLGKSEMHGMAAELKRKMEECDISQFSPEVVCRGHDATEMLRWGLREVFGAKRNRDLDVSDLERELRLAYEEAFFAEEALANAIRGWEDRTGLHTGLVRIG